MQNLNVIDDVELEVEQQEHCNTFRTINLFEDIYMLMKVFFSEKQDRLACSCDSHSYGYIGHRLIQINNCMR